MKKALAVLLLTALAASVANSAAAGVLICRVVKVYDGDTVTAWCGGRKVRIRLACIDAPEKRQEHGVFARRVLARMIQGRTVQVRVKTRDRYGRTVGTILVDDLSVNRAMVRRGAAWVYRRYCRDPGMLSLEEKARRSRAGLWANPHPTPPWRWRREKRRKSGTF